MDCLPEPIISEEVSYIRPRDPSIQNFNRNNLKRVRMNMQFSMSEESISETSESTAEVQKNSLEEDRLQIFLRVKPSVGNIRDVIIHENEFVYKTSEQDVRNPKSKETIHKKIVFNEIYRGASKQINIFEDIVKVKVFEFINGKDTSLFTYGSTGSGRTYTTIGTEEEPGLLIRSLEYIFKTLPELQQISTVKPTPDGKILNLTPIQMRSELALKTSILKSQRATERLGNIKLYQVMQEKLQNEPFAFLDQLADISIGVWVSFVEIHNEEILDLLQNSVDNGKRRLRIGVSNGKPYITDLTHICVSNGLEAFQMYQYGKQKLKCMKTNLHSSSNSIFTIKIAHGLLNKETKFLSAFSICNLANGTDNSVIVLGKCIAKLRSSHDQPNHNKYIPYRDSKITQLFHRACLGLQDFCVIISIALSKEKWAESQNVLNFPALTKELISKVTFSKYIALESQYSLELDDHIKNLKEAIHKLQVIYEDLVKNKSTNYEMEKQTLIQGYEEVLRDTEKLFNMRKKNLEEKYEDIYQMELRELETKLKRKIEQKRRKKTQDEIRNLKEKYEAGETDVKNLQLEVSSLEIKLNMAKDFASRIEHNNKLIAELEESVEKDEMDSFISNEIECESNNGSIVT